MLRRLLACLALISGLTAVGTPVHATIVEAVGSTLEQTEQCEKNATRAFHPNIERQGEHRGRGDAGKPFETCRTIAILTPRVLIGIDRSFE